MDTGLYRLVGEIQNYAWGGHDFIPEVLGLQPAAHTAYAEYWLGAHDKAPSKVILDDNRTEPLNKLIDSQPQRVLGPGAYPHHTRLPYLLKILDVEKPLSVQVHPTKPQARAGFQRENEWGIAIDSPERNYRDKNHKPELMVALGDFWLLHGFLPQGRLAQVLRDVAEFQALLKDFEQGGYAQLYERVMTLPVEEANAMLQPVVERIRAKNRAGLTDKLSADYWVERVVATGDGTRYDRGIFSIFFLNLVTLTKGQAIFQDAGIPHAYLQGQNIELMANSDNVLRGGLTEKHVDVPELLRTVRLEGIEPRVIEGTTRDNLFEAHFECPAQDFHLSRIQLGKGDSWATSTQSVEVLLLMEGTVAVDGGRQRLSLDKGQSAVVFGESDYRISALSRDATLFRASLP